MTMTAIRQFMYFGTGHPVVPSIVMCFEPNKRQGKQYDVYRKWAFDIHEIPYLPILDLRLICLQAGSKYCRRRIVYHH